jgi:hypothetical protein
MENKSFYNLFEDIKVKFFESLSQARKLYLDTGKIESPDFQDLEQANPTDTNKYIEWMCKQFLVDQNNKQDIIDLIPEFDRLVNKNLIKNKDINSYKFLSQLKTEVSRLENKTSKTQIKKDIKVSGSDVVYEDNVVKVVNPKTHEASKIYGSNTKWCTTEKDPKTWNDYSNRAIKMYYFLPKNNSEKYAAAVYPDNKMEIFNDQDKKG